ncbi:MAG: hypothetical protein NTX86_06215 [Candidatus Dependentiae bacterium]|nr:hypothetical protein [Candidatus Dependentiae bacterium]
MKNTINKVLLVAASIITTNAMALTRGQESTQALAQSAERIQALSQRADELMKAGANLDDKDAEGKTLIMRIVDSLYPVKESFINYRDYIAFFNDFIPNTIIYWDPYSDSGEAASNNLSTLKATLESAKNSIDLLIKNGASVATTDNSKVTAWQRGLNKSYLDFIRILNERVNHDVAARQQYSPLYQIARDIALIIGTPVNLVP